MLLAEFQSRGAPPVLRVELAGLDPEGALERIVDDIRRHRTTRLDLGAVDAGDAGTTALLAGLAELRREHLYGFAFRCRVAAPLPRAQALLMRAAGVAHVRLDPPPAGAGALQANARLLEAVKRLHGAGVAVEWEAVPAAGEEAAVVELFAGAVHLPPPAESPGEGGGALHAALSAWRVEHAPRTLTYARGPGFVRLFDRRRGVRDWTFIALNAVQSEIFLFCEGARSLPEIVASVSGAEPERLRAFLEAMAERRVMSRVGSDAFLSLPVRRTLEERWASADHDHVAADDE
jgi:hypothetical protein